jgi:DNA-binding LytR/AlgR family response regulator
MRQIAARRKDRFVLLNLERIICFRIESGLLRAWTASESYLTDYQINELETRLPGPPFFRAHRNAIVNLDHVKEIVPFLKSTFLLLLDDVEGTEIRVSERRSKTLRELLRT